MDQDSSPAAGPPNALAPQTPTGPQSPTLQPLHNPDKPCPFLTIRLFSIRCCCFATPPFCPTITAPTLTPSSLTIHHAVPQTPLYGPTGTLVLSSATPFGRALPSSSVVGSGVNVLLWVWEGR